MRLDFSYNAFPGKCRVYTLLFTFIFCGLAFSCLKADAQEHNKGILSGKLLDSTTKEGLKGATIILKDGTDSTRWRYGLSKEGGVFHMSTLSPGMHILSISFQGYNPKTVSFSIEGSRSSLNLGNIYLPVYSNTLGVVVVSANSAVRVRKDTLDFNPSQFHTRPNADLGEVIGKMPGMVVDKNGNITAQGEPVQRVLVNGKRFFSNDPTLAIKNLPPEVIARIEVFDDLSDQSKFTGIDDGQRVKTINIITKKNIRRGDFGKVVAGGGASQEKGLYQGSVGLHHLDGDRMLSVIGQANNTNGLTTSTAGGANYSDLWGKTTKAYGSYHINRSETVSGQQSNTVNIIPGDSSLFAHASRNGKNANTNQNLNFNTESKFDPFNSLTARTSMNWQRNVSESRSNTYTTKGISIPLNNSAGNAANASLNYSGTVDLLYGHLFRRPMRSISVGLNAGLNSGDGKTFNEYLNHYYNGNLPDSAITVNQYFHSPTENRNLSLTVSYIEPLTSRAALELNYNYSANSAVSGRYGFNYDSVTHSYSRVDTTLTNRFANQFNSNRLSLTYRFNSQKLNFNAGMGMQEGSKSSQNLSKATQLERKYTNLYPTVNLNYNMGASSHLNFNYDGRTNQPSLNDLQPITDNSDPLHVKIGNPDLKQQFSHNFRLLYNSFNRQNFRNFFATINASITRNNIVSRTITNTRTGADTVSLVNLNGSYNINANINYGFQLKDPRSNLSFGTSLADNHSVGFINGLLNESSNYSFGETVKWTTNLKEHFDMNFSATPTYNLALYSAVPGQNNHYFSQTVTADATYFTKAGWMAASDVNYTSYSGRAVGFNTTTLVWNGSIARLLFSKRQGELRLTVHDLLNQSSSLIRTVSPTMIQDVENRVLTRYFLLTFTYHIRHFSGGAGPRPHAEG